MSPRPVAADHEHRAIRGGLLAKGVTLRQVADEVTALRRERGAPAGGRPRAAQVSPSAVTHVLNRKRIGP